MSLSGSTSRHCYAVGCTNGDYRLRKWKDSFCDTHRVLQEKCSCPPPFQLFTFPTKRMNNDKRQRWIQILKRASSSNPNEYQDPSKDQRLCSDHFIDGQPTDQNPDPTLKLGHSLKRPNETSGQAARFAKRLCKSDKETYTAEILTKTEDINPSPSYKSRTCSLPALTAANQFMINILLSLLRKYKGHTKLLEEENMLLKAKVATLEKNQS